MYNKGIKCHNKHPISIFQIKVLIIFVHYKNAFLLHPDFLRCIYFQAVPIIFLNVDEANECIFAFGALKCRQVWVYR